MTQASYVIVARADHIGDVIVECQMTINEIPSTRMAVDTSTVVSTRWMPAVLSNSATCDLVPVTSALVFDGFSRSPLTRCCRRCIRTVGPSLKVDHDQSSG